MEDDALGKAARHTGLKSASRYYMDALTKYHDARRVHVWPMEKVSPWKPNWVETAVVDANDDVTTQTQLPLADLVPWYVQEELKLTGPSNKLFNCAIRHALYKKPNLSASEELHAMLEEHIPVNICSLVNLSIHAL